MQERRADQVVRAVPRVPLRDVDALGLRVDRALAADAAGNTAKVLSELRFIQTQIPERVENLDARAVLLRSVTAVIADIEQGLAGA